MLVTAVVVPAAPLLVPDVSSGAASEAAAIRDSAIAGLSRCRDLPVVLIGAAPRTGAWPVTAVASFAGFGVGERPTSSPALPPALSVGRDLMDAAGLAPAWIMGVAEDEPPAGCRAVGEQLAGLADRIAAVVVGDGSARRTPTAPGAFDERAAPFDAAWTAALAAADTESLLAVDPLLARELLAQGRAAWQVLAAMASASGTARCAAPPVLEDRYGVQYAVAAWDVVP